MRKEGNCTARKIEQVSRSLENPKVEGCEDLQGERVVYGHIDFFFLAPSGAHASLEVHESAESHFKLRQR